LLVVFILIIDEGHKGILLYVVAVVQETGHAKMAAERRII
jgi:hypothetical protein